MITEIFSFMNEWRIASPIIFSFVGIVINFIILWLGTRDDPQGDQAAAWFFIPCFIPFVMVFFGAIVAVIWTADRVLKLLGFRGFI